MNYIRQIRTVRLSFDNLDSDQADALVDFYNSGCKQERAPADGRITDTMRSHLFALWGQLYEALGEGCRSRGEFTDMVLGHQQSWSDMTMDEATLIKYALRGALVVLGEEV